MADKKVISLDRRNVLKACGSAVVAGAAIAGFPAIIRAQSRTPTLRVVGTHVTLQEKIRRRAEKDLGINIEFYPGGSAEVMLRASTAPDSFDLYEQWSNSLNTLWQANTIQPIQISRLTYWDEVNDLTKKGKLSPDARIGLGDAPYKLLYVQPDGTLGATQAKSISFLPYVHNVTPLATTRRSSPEVPLTKPRVGAGCWMIVIGARLHWLMSQASACSMRHWRSKRRV